MKLTHYLGLKVMRMLHLKSIEYEILDEKSLLDSDIAIFCKVRRIYYER